MRRTFKKWSTAKRSFRGSIKIQRSHMGKPATFTESTRARPWRLTQRTLNSLKIWNSENSSSASKRGMTSDSVHKSSGSRKRRRSPYSKKLPKEIVPQASSERWILRTMRTTILWMKCILKSKDSRLRFKKRIDNWILCLKIRKMSNYVKMQKITLLK